MEKLLVNLDRDTVDKGGLVTHLHVDLDLGEGLTQRETTLLFNAARKCEVSELINGKFTFSYKLLAR